MRVWTYTYHSPRQWGWPIRIERSETRIRWFEVIVFGWGFFFDMDIK